MDLQIILTIVGIVLSALTTFAIFYLRSIRESQDQIVNEIKEMNKDIRDTLIRIGKNDERFLSVDKRVDDVLIVIKTINDRLYKLEEHGVQG